MPLKIPKIALTAVLTLALVFTFSCYDEYKPNDRIVVRKEKISGVSQKGPFTQGAKVKIYELNRNMEKMGEPYEGTTDGDGNFVIEIEGGIITSPYIILEVNGKYINEVNGKQSDAPVTLNAVADVSKKSIVNINVFTHLEYAKVLELAKSGESFEDAKKEAQKEVLNALGMSEVGVESSEEMSLFGGSKGDSLLLVASVLLQGNRQTTAEVSSLLDAIIRDNGTLSKGTKEELARGVEGLDMNKVMGNILKLDSSARVPSINDINNIVGHIASSSSNGGGYISSNSQDSLYYEVDCPFEVEAVILSKITSCGWDKSSVEAGDSATFLMTISDPTCAVEKARRYIGTNTHEEYALFNVGQAVVTSGAYTELLIGDPRIPTDSLLWPKEAKAFVVNGAIKCGGYVCSKPCSPLEIK